MVSWSALRFVLVFSWPEANKGEHVLCNNRTLCDVRSLCKRFRNSAFFHQSCSCVRLLQRQSLLSPSTLLSRFTCIYFALAQSDGTRHSGAVRPGKTSHLISVRWPGVVHQLSPPLCPMARNDQCNRHGINTRRSFFWDRQYARS